MSFIGSTIPSRTPRVAYEAYAQTTFAVPFEVLSATDLVVDVDGTVQTYLVHYTVSVAADFRSATVTFFAPRTGTVTITRSTTIELPEKHDPAVPAIDKALLHHQLARLTMIAQDIAAGGGGGGGGGGGSGGGAAADDSTLLYDGSDETVAFQALIDAAIAAGKSGLVLNSRGGTLGLSGKVNIHQPDPGRSFTVDFTRCRVRYRTWNALIRSNSRKSEWPKIGKPVLAATAPAGSTSITVDTSPNGGDISRFVTGAEIIIRGAQDATGEPLDNQLHITVLTADAVDNGNGRATLTFADPLPAQFAPTYPASAWAGSKLNSSGRDDTLVSVTDMLLVDGNGGDPQAGDTVIRLVGNPGTVFAVGDFVMMLDDQLSATGTTEVPGAPYMVVAVGVNTVTLDQPLHRSYSTAARARVVKEIPSWNVAIVGLHNPINDQDAQPDPASRIPTIEFRRTINPRADDILVDDTVQANSRRGPAVRFDYCIRPHAHRVRRIGRLDTTHSSGGDRYGIHMVGSREDRLTDCWFERCRHGIVKQGGYLVVGRGLNGRNNGNLLDLHGLQAVDAVFVGCFSERGDWLPDGFSEQKFATIGNTAHRGADGRVLFSGCRAVGYDGGAGAIELRGPWFGVAVLGCSFEDGVDAVVIKSVTDQTVPSRDLFVDGIALRNMTGYAVDNDTNVDGVEWTSGTCKIGVVVSDGSETGIYSSNYGDQAERPDLVPDKGSLTIFAVPINTTPYTTSNADLSFEKTSASYDIIARYLVFGTPDGNPKQVNLHDVAPLGSSILLEVPDAQTGDVTIGLDGTASFDSGETSIQVAPPFGNGASRWMSFRAVGTNGAGGTIWRLEDGDVRPQDDLFTVRYPISSPTRDEVFSGSLTFSSSLFDAAQFVFTGASPATFTLDTPPEVRPGVAWTGRWPVWNRGSANLTIQISGGGSLVVPAGQCALIAYASGAWMIAPGGAFTT